jgi:hypothetical protein
MEPRQNVPLTDSLPEGWKWAALFATPEPLQNTWRAWLAEAQRAEEQTVLRYWAQRASSTPDELDQAA